MGASRAARAQELAALSHALALGYRLIDTAEMYAEGGADRLVGAALAQFGAGRRGELFIVSKVLPSHASRRGTVRACEASIERMGCAYLDLYLLHWSGAEPFGETLRGFEELRRRGLIRHFGVSNLDQSELVRWLEAERALGLETGAGCNQLYYCLEARAIEFALLPWQRAHGIQTMAYSPLGQGALAHHPLLELLGSERGVSAAEIALAWAARDPDVVAIPKSVQPQRLDRNLAAAALRLTAGELARLEAAFPAPRCAQPLPTV